MGGAVHFRSDIRKVGGGRAICFRSDTKSGGGAIRFRSDTKKWGGGSPLQVRYTKRGGGGGGGQFASGTIRKVGGGGGGGNSLQVRYGKWRGGGADTFVWHKENTLSLIINGYSFDQGGCSSTSHARANELKCRF